MPAVSSIRSKYSQEYWLKTKNELLNLIDLESKKISFFDKYKIKKKDFNVFINKAKGLDWLTNQEVNSIIEYSPEATERVKFLFHRFKFSFLAKHRIYSEIPAYILIEPCSICNMRCPMCYQTDKSFTTKSFMGKMDLDLYKKIIDECFKQGIGSVTLASRGEPTLHPQLGEMIKYGKGKIMEFKMNTNASRLTKELSYQILDSTLSHLVFSVDSHIKEEYESIRKGGKFDEIYENIKYFWNLRNSSKFKSRKIRVSISGIKVFDSQDPEGFKNFWQDYADDAYLSKPQERWDTYNNEILHSFKETCIYPWERLYIWHDGIINPCDVDYKSTLSPGNIKELGSIVKAWKELKTLREKMLSGNRNSISPCDRCGVSHVHL